MIQIILLVFVFRTNSPAFERWTMSFSPDQGLEDLLRNKINESEKQDYNENSESINHYPIAKFSSDTFENLRTPIGRRALLAGCLIHIMLQLSGIHMMLFYTYYYAISDQPNHYNLRFVLTGLSVLLNLVTIYFMKIYRRKPLQLVGYIGQ